MAGRSIHVASSFTSVAITRVFNSALAGNSKDRPGLVGVRLPLGARVAVLRCRGGEEFLRRLFEPIPSKCRIGADGRCDREETGPLKRGTLHPKLDFLVLPLTRQRLAAIEKAINSKIAFGYKGILHVQIESNGKIAFAAYDNFHQECVVAYSAVSSALLDELTETRILWNYKRVPQSAG